MLERIIGLLIAIVIVATACFARYGDAGEPQITEQEFHFRVEYTVNGETFTLEDSVVCRYAGLVRNRGHASPSEVRSWEETLKSTGEQFRDAVVLEQYQSKSAIKDRINSYAVVYLSFGRAEYYMGERTGSRQVFEYSETAKPGFYYYERYTDHSGRLSRHELTRLSEDQCRELFGIEITGFSFPPPIQNTFTRQ